MIQPLAIQSSIQQSNDVLLIGVWGMGGTGKTTIAKVIYNKIGRNFEGRSFLANIREVWEQNVGQVSLQEQILFDICKETKAGIQNIDKGKSILKDKLGHKIVLLVLDDVNTLNQLNALCGGRLWFGSGSRIIITTRNMDLLKGNRVDKLYKMQEMNERESIERKILKREFGFINFEEEESCFNDIESRSSEEVVKVATARKISGQTKICLQNEQFL
ncbi:hypothetical protein RYX36_008751 [Vicia faba]